MLLLPSIVVLESAFTTLYFYILHTPFHSSGKEGPLVQQGRKEKAKHAKRKPSQTLQPHYSRTEPIQFHKLVSRTSKQQNKKFHARTQQVNKQ